MLPILSFLKFVHMYQLYRKLDSYNVPDKILGSKGVDLEAWASFPYMSNEVYSCQQGQPRIHSLIQAASY